MIDRNADLSATNFKDLIEALFYSRWIAPLLNEWDRRAKEAGQEPIQFFLSQLGEKQATVAATTDIGNKLGEELLGMLQSGWDFTGPIRPDEAREFCSPQGNIYELTEGELTEKQARFLALIRKFYRRWIGEQQ